VAFPTTSVLDNFDRANTGPPPSASWTGDASMAAAECKVISNTVAANASNGFDYWNPTTYGPDSECFMDIPTKPGSGQYAAVYVRFDPPGNNGYEVELDVAAGTDSVLIFRCDNTVFTQLGASISQEFTAGDSLGLEMIGSTLQAYRKSGTWSALGTTRTDGTYTVAGNLALQFGDTTARGDNFGGGTVVVSSDTLMAQAIM
jgi:hypothetical protein